MGEKFEVTVGEGAMAQTVTVVSGEETTTTEPSDDLTAPTGVTVSKLQNSITVSWTPNSAQNAVQIKAVLYDDAVTRIVDIGTYNPAAGDPGIHTFRNVAAGTYKVTVASFRSGDGHKLSLPLQTVEIE